MSENLIEFNGISKFFGKVIALKDVTMKVKNGEIMCLLGDNGAGKSTLIKYLFLKLLILKKQTILQRKEWVRLVLI